MPRVFHHLRQNQAVMAGEEEMLAADDVRPK